MGQTFLNAEQAQRGDFKYKARNFFICAEGRYYVASVKRGTWLAYGGDQNWNLKRVLASGYLLSENVAIKLFPRIAKYNFQYGSCSQLSNYPIIEHSQPRKVAGTGFTNKQFK